MSPGTLGELVTRWAERCPDLPCLLAPGRPPLSFGDLRTQLAGLASALGARGVSHASRVAVVLPPGPEMAVAVLGTAVAATCAPLDPASRAGELDAGLTRLEATLVITGRALDAPVLEVARRRGLAVIEVPGCPDRPAGWLDLGAGAPDAPAGLPGRAPGDPALVLRTSGTTGAPKVVTLSQGNLCASAVSISTSLALTSADRCLDVMPLFHIHGLMVLLASLAAGGSAVCPPAFDPRAFPGWLEAGQPTWYSAVPTIHHAILRELEGSSRARALAPLRFVRSSSAPLPGAVAARIEATFGVPAIEAYGMTEASHQIATNPLPPGERRRGSVGRPAGAEVAILDEAGRPLPAGSTGEIAIRGPGVTAAPDDTGGPAGRAGGWLRTGDQGYQDRDGYLYLTGRLKELVNRGGETIAPREIEAVLLEHPAVAEAAVFAVPHPTLGEDVAAAVVARAGAPVTEAALRAFATTHLADARVPRTVLVLDALPAGATGKVDRRALARLAARGPEPAPEADASRDPDATRRTIEATVARLAAELLRVERVGRHDSFFALGGDSLTAGRLATRIEEALGIAVTLQTVFLATTPAALAEAIAGQGPSGARGSDLRFPAGSAEHPVSSGQAALWFLQRLDPGGTAYNRPVTLRLEGPLVVRVLEAALAEIERRHEILRTAFPALEGRPVARVGPPASVSLAVEDLVALPDGARDQELRRREREEAATPFDLAEGPVYRARLLRLGPTRHALLLTFHHAVFDGWSEGILVRELAALYEAFLAGRPSPLAEPPVQYRDFAARQAGRLDDGVLAEDLAYWRGRLGGERGRIELPARDPQAAETGTAATRQTIEVPEPTVEALRALGRAEGATLFMALLAALDVLLVRYAGQPDILVATVVAGRDTAALEGLIGFFANTLVMRTDLAGTPTFRALLGRVRQTAIEAYGHQALPYSRLVEALAPARDEPHRDPLCRVMLVAEPPVAETTPAGPLAIHPLDLGGQAPRFDLTLRVEEHAGRLRVHAEFAPERLDPGAASRLLGHLRTLIEGAVADPDQPITALPLLAPEERHRVLVEWNRTARDYSLGQGLHQLVEAQARRTPDAVAVELDEQRLTYRELDRQATRLAGALRARGVAPGDRVGVALERSPDLVAAILAVLKAGAAYTPIDPDYPRERLAFLLRDAGLALLLTDERLLATLPPPPAPVLLLGRDEPGPAAAPGARLPVAVAPGDIAYVIYTSGSTGTPKGTLNTHRGIVNHLLWTQEAFPLTPADRVLHKTPIGFDVSVWELCWPLVAGARLVLARARGHLDTAYLVHLVQTAGVTVLHFVPSMLRLFLEQPGVEACRSIRQVLSSGEVLPGALAQRCLTLLPGARLDNLYGPAETAVHVTAWPCGPGDRGRIVPIGRPLANTQAYVLDDGGQPLPVGVPGELCVGGVQVGPGYLDRPELTAERFVPDPFAAGPGTRLYRTGDRARWRPDGVLEFLGRLDFQVKIRGVRVEPGEIEATLRTHPGVQDAVVVARQRDGDPRLVAYVVPRGPAPDAAELRQFLRRTLPEPMVPEAFVPIERVPIGPNGKVDRRALPDPAEGAAPAAGVATPGTPEEAALAGIWAEVLGRETVGIHDDFFALGGHSLLATRLLARVEAAFGSDVSLRQFFATPTVAGLAAALPAMADRAPAAPAPHARPARADEGMPLSSAQLRFWLLDRLYPGHPALDTPAAFRLAGALDAGALARSVQALVDRHEALRTTFRLVDGEPRQIVHPALAASLPVLDLSHLPRELREARARQQCAEWAERTFDLALGPLFDARLLRMAPDDHVLVLNLHHAVSDAWTVAILLEDLAALYAACRAGRDPALPPLPLQYADHALREREHLGSAAAARQVEYWRHQLAPPLPRLSLAGDRRPATRTFRGGRCQGGVDAVTAGRLRQLGHAEGASVFMVLLAAFQALLGEDRGLDEVVVGAPVSNRPGTAFERVAGCFLNTLLLRGSLAGDPTFRELVRRARDVVLEAHANRDVPVERVLAELRLARAGGAPPVEALLNMHEFQDEELALPGLEVTPFTHAGEGALVDLTVYFRTVAGGLDLWAGYDADLLDAARVAGLLERYAAILATVAADPELRLGALSRGRRPGHPPSAAIPASPAREPIGAVPWASIEATIPERFEQIWRAQPARPALAVRGVAWTYEQLAHAARRIAGRLLAAAGAGEDRVGLLLDHDAPMVAAILGTLYAGKVYVPLDPAHPPARLRAMIEDSGATLLLTDGRNAATARGLAGDGVPVLDGEAAAQEAGHEPPPARVAPDRLAYLLYTSGSTGAPKGVMQCHRNVLHFMRAYARNLAIGPEDRLSLVASYGFDAAVMDIFGALLSGATLCLWDVRGDGLEGMADWLDRERVTIYHSTPTLLRHFLAQLPAGRVLSGVRLVVMGGEALFRSDVELFRQRFGPGCRLVNGLGPTESTVTLQYIVERETPIEGTRVPVGFPVEDTEVELLDEDGAPHSTAGEIAIRSRYVALGYWGQPELTRAAFLPDPAGGDCRVYRTGDLGLRRPDGAIEFRGRRDEQVKIRGHRVEPGEVEAWLRRHPGVRDAAVVAREEAPGEARLVGFVVPAGSGPLDVAGVRRFLRTALPDAMVPAALVALAALPLTPTGKIDRRRLPAATPPPPTEPAAPASPVERAVADLWAELMGAPPGSVDEDFFDAGGDSLRAAWLVARVHRTLGVDVPLRRFFETPTVAALALAVAEGLLAGLPAGGAAGAADSAAG